jgi:hypothetical protein
LGEVSGPNAVVNEEGRAYALDPEDRVLTPIDRPNSPEQHQWCFQRSSRGDVVIFPLPEGRSVYFRKAEIDARDGSERPFFPTMIAGNERYFLELRSPTVVEDEGDELTYEEDGERGPDDSFGPADTNIFP